ncbi:MAG: serine/threonine-protein kinase [Aeromicrobium sp.]
MLADRYELDHEIGRGGMGAVWLGRDTVLSRTVAIKQIGMTHGSVAPDLDRAEREAHLAARINHQNVVAVFDLVDDGGHQWLVMEHVDGPTLAALVAERGALAPEELAPVLRQIAGALAAAHGHGIVHRDVKPSNILLTSDGTAKLSDFGVARAQADAALTQTGLVTGSPAYLSPEVAMGRNATPASDVWSLGTTMFHALAGHAPYDIGDNVLGGMYRIVNEEPPRLAGGGALAPLVEAMMQLDPEARPTMADIERAVSDAVPVPVVVGAVATAGEGTVAFAPLEPADPPTLAAPPLPPADLPPPRTHRDSGRNRRLWVAAGGVVAVMAVVLLIALTRDGDPAPTTPSAAEPSTGQTSASPSQSPDPTPTTDGQAAPTPAELEGFASDYLTAASNDPKDGFALLTPDYQDESGGFRGYKGFWGKVKDVDVQAVRGDPDRMTVSYTYSYDYKGDRITEDVTLRLEPAGDSFLVAGTA